jgi:hypothetical protein
LILESLVATEAIDPKRDTEAEVRSSSSNSSPLNGKDRRESGELRSLLPELVDAIDGVLAAPKEKLGEGSGPGIGDGKVREVTV